MKIWHAAHSAIALLLVSSVLVIGTGGPVEAAVIRGFTPRFMTNTTGAIVMTGNTLLTCPTSATNCLAARSGKAPTLATNDNNNFVMTFVDVDNDATTFNSSRNTLAVPPTGSIAWAGLYWGSDTSAGGGSGSVAPTASANNRVLFATPGSAGYQSITASRLDNTGTRYQGFADVTSLVRAAGAGEYTVANVQAGRGNDRYGGWALVVAYQDPNEPLRNLTIFDGYAVVQRTPSSDQNVAIPISGFLTPPSGAVRSRIGVVAFEGDIGLINDSFRLNSTPVTNSLNPATNFFNGSLTGFGVTNTTGVPNQTNMMGIDIDTIDANGILANGATSATINLNTTDDTYFPGVVSFSTELYAPEIRLDKSAVDVNGGSLDAGDQVLYTIRATNTGNDPAKNVVITDVVPDGTTYVPGSLTIDGLSVTDAPGDDTGEFANSPSRVVARVGNAATTSTGGTLPIGASRQMTFAVTVGLVGPNETIDNSATGDYAGATSGLVLSVRSNTVTLTPRARADLSITIDAPTGPLTVPTSFDYDITVINNGPAREPAAVVTDTLPPGFVATGATASQGSCVLGAPVTCQVGGLDVGATATIRVTVSVAAGSGRVTNTASVSGSALDANPSNNSNSATVVLNNRPVAAPQTATTPSGTPTTVIVQTGSSDADGDPISTIAATNPANGSVTVNTDGTVTYTPRVGYKGDDTFAFTLSDGAGGTATESVTITVLNAAPTALDDAAAIAPSQATTISVLGNDTDPNSDVLRVTGVTQPPGGSTTGLVTFDGTSVTFAPNASFSGTATFTYTITDDDGGFATASVSVLVPNAAPVAVADSASTDHATLVDVDVVVNDLDDNNEPLRIVSIGALDPTVGTAFDLGGGIIRFTPADGFKGDAIFDYTITDEASTATAPVTITVRNAPPVATPIDATTAAGLRIDVDPIAASSDPNRDPLTVAAVSTPSAGTATVNPDGTVSYTSGLGFKGVDTFTYTVSDGTATATATVTITVPNAPPVAISDARATSAATAVMIPVLLNDTDPNPVDTLTLLSAEATTAGGGSVAVNGDGTLTYTPSASFKGDDTFTYVVTDGTDQATGTVTVAVANAAPVANEDRVTTATDTVVTVSPLANDTDANGDRLTLSSTTVPANGTIVVHGDGTITYSPNPGFKGDDAFSYTVSDGTDTASGAIVVTVANAAPVAADILLATLPGAAAVVDVAANSSDANNDPLSIVAFTQPAGGVVTDNGDGTLTFTPNLGFRGTAVFSYTVSDGTASATGTVSVTVPDAAPVALDDQAETSRATPVTVTVLANDLDDNGDDLTISAVGDPGFGTATPNGDGTITYTPNATFRGIDSFTYTITDGTSTASAVVHVTVTNAPPIAENDTVDTASETPIDIDVLGNDRDPNGDTLTIVAVSSPMGGIVVNSSGTLTYTPGPGFKGVDTFTYTISDGIDTVTGDVTVTVGNAAPIALDDAVATPGGAPVVISVLDNDSDANNDPLQVTGVANMVGGTATVNGDGTITFTPNSGFSGQASFEYTISDGTDSASARVTIAVPNAAPVAVDDAATTATNTPVVVFVLGNDLDDNGESLRITNVTAPASGTAAANADGSITYTPGPGFRGADTFAYTITDESATATATVRVTVLNAPPSATDDLAATGPSTAIAIDVLGNDNDPNGDDLVVIGTTPSANGTVTIAGDGRLVYTPGVGFKGVDTFTYTISDGIDAATATVRIDVANAPPVAADDNATTTRATPVTIDLLGNDSDSNGDALSVDALSVPANGAVSDNGDGTVTYTPGPTFRGVDTFTYTISDGTDAATATVAVSVGNAAPIAGDDTALTAANTPVTIDVLGNDVDSNAEPLGVVSASIPAGGSVVIDAAGTVTYTPNTAFKGVDTFTYTITDGTDVATATVTVTVGNAAPIAVDDATSTLPGTAVLVRVLDNDRDPNGDALTIASFTPPSSGAVTGTAVGVVTQTAADVLTFTPATGFSGVATFTYVVSDGTDTGTATVTVNVPNAGPVAADDVAVTDAATSVDIDVLANDLDDNGQTLTVTAVSVPTSGTTTINGDNTVTYTPATGFKGDDSFTYTITDGTDTATATVTVTVRNAPPVSTAVSATTTAATPIAIDIFGSVTDANGDPVAIIGITQPAGGSVIDDGDGTVSYTPNPGFKGDDTFTVVVSDGTDSTTVTVTVTVGNAAPMAFDDVAVTESNTAVDIAVTGNDTDANSDVLRVVSTSVPGNGSVVISGTGTVTYTPATGFKGDDTFTYTITDGTDIATATVTVTVGNAAPVAVDDAVATPPSVPAVIRVLDNDSDSNGDVLTIVSFTRPFGGPATGVVSDNGDGTLTFTPNPVFRGTATFTYTITDGTDVATATVTVLVPRSAPVAVDDAASTTNAAPVDVAPMANDLDDDAEPLTITAIGTPVNGSLVDNGDGTFTYTPGSAFKGVEEIGYSITDGTDTASATIRITVANAVPVAIDDDYSTAAGTTISFDVTINDTDANGDVLVVVGTTPPSNGSVTVGSDGRLRYTPGAGSKGVDTFTYTVSDGTDSASATVRVTVDNTAPVAVDDFALTAAGMPVTVDVLGNDSDANADLLSVVSTTTPAGGSVVIDAAGTVTYTPATGFKGVDTFTYTITDGTDVAMATVTVTVGNAAPIGVDDATSTLPSTAVAIDVLDNDRDPNGDALSIVSFTPPSSGALTGAAVGTVNQTAPGVLTFTPATGFSGVATFSYVVGDGTDTATATVTVNVPNAGPVAADDVAVTNAASSVDVDVLANDLDDNGQTLTVTAVSVPSAGVAVINGDNTVTYTPNTGFKGADSFTYTITDGTDVASATVTVTVGNAAPVATPVSATTAAATPVAIDIFGSVIDANSDPVSIIGVGQPVNGTVVDNGDGTVTYTPNPGFKGDDVFTVVVSDGTDSTRVTVTVSVGNAAPLAFDDAIVTASATAVDVVVTGNDTDANSDLLRVVSTTAPGIGSVVISGIGIVTYTPATGFKGDDTFTYTITDGTDTATASVTVTVGNAAPVAVDDATSTLPSTAVPVRVLDNDSDANGEALTVVSFTRPFGGPATGVVTDNGDGTLTFAPNPVFRGTATFTYTITDGTDIATATVTVLVPRSAPVAVDDAASTTNAAPVDVAPLANDLDDDAEPLTVTSIGAPVNGSLVDNGDGTFTYTPGSAFKGVEEIGYSITDGTDTASATIRITVANAVPVAIDDDYSTATNNPITIDPTINDTDANVDPLTVIGLTQPGRGSAAVDQDGNVVYTPEVGFTGDDSFTYTISDGTDTATATVRIVVTGAAPGGPPNAVDDSVTTGFDTAVIIDVLDNDSDPDGDPLRVLSATTPGHGVASVDIEGIITYTPEAGFSGVDTFFYTISDGTASSTAMVTVTVAADPGTGTGTDPGTGTTPPPPATSTDPTNPTTSGTPTTPGGGNPDSTPTNAGQPTASTTPIPRTGGDVLGLMLAGSVVLGIGLLLFSAARRRPSSTA